jgi:hypothetical protein
MCRSASDHSNGKGIGPKVVTPIIAFWFSGSQTLFGNTLRETLFREPWIDSKQSFQQYVPKQSLATREKGHAHSVRGLHGAIPLSDSSSHSKQSLTQPYDTEKVSPKYPARFIPKSGGSLPPTYTQTYRALAANLSRTFSIGPALVDLAPMAT